MRPVVGIAAAALAGLFAGPLLAQEIDYKGFLDSYHAVRVHDPYDFLSSRTRLRMETWFSMGDASAFFSFNAIQNSVIEENTGFEIREAFIDYAAESWDLRVGRQIIVWGKADGLAITDIVSPWDYTEFLAQDFDDIRMPVEALRWRLLTDQLTFELLWLPRFEAAILAPAGTPWAVTFELPAGVDVTFDQTIKPDFTIRNSEIGSKLSLYLPWADLAFSAFYTWDDLPAMHRTVSVVDRNVSIRFRPEHHRVTFVGAEFSLPRGEFVFRGESAFYTGKRFEPEDQLSEELFERKLLKWMIGVDWSPGGDWTVSAQLTDDFILDHTPAIRDVEHTVLATLSVSKRLFRQTLELASFSFIGLNGNAFSRSYADYALTDEIHLLGGVDVFIGDEGLLGQFNANDEVWFKVKYSF